MRTDNCSVGRSISVSCLKVRNPFDEILVMDRYHILSNDCLDSESDMEVMRSQVHQICFCSFIGHFVRGDGRPRMRKEEISTDARVGKCDEHEDYRGQETY